MKKKAIAIITTILLSISIFMDTPFAEAHGPNNIVFTPYGTCTSEFYYDSSNSTHNITLGGVTIPQVGPVNLLRYTFTHPYTGTFDLDITISGVLSNRWELMTSNCYLVSVVDETTLRFAVNNAEYCEIAIMPSQYNNKLVFTLENQNLTAVDDTTTAVNDILTHVSYIDGQIQQIHADTTMIRNLLISMSGYTADSNDNIATDMDTLISIMTNIQQFSDIPDYSLSAFMLMRSYGYALNYDSDINYPYFQATNMNISQNVGTFYMDSGTEISFIFATTPYSFNTTNIATWYSTMNRTNFSYQLLNQLGRYYIYKVNFKNIGNGYDYVGIKFNQNYRVYPIYLGLPQNIPVNVNALSRIFIDDRYTTKLQGIIDAVNNMSLNVNQLTVNATGITYNVNNTQVNNSVTTYNTDIQNVYNVENDFSATFNTYNQQFTPDFTETMTTIQSVPDVMNDIVVDLYGLPFIKYPLLLTLAGIVLIALLGV